jgi:heme/copper-type cytochrome/quinol oxidase subunit 4
MRTLVAFVGAPVIPAVIAAWVVHLNRTYEPPTMLVFVCLSFYALQAIIGVPAYMFMTRKNLHRVWIYLLLGCFGAALPLLLSFIWRQAEKGYGLAEYALLYYPALLGTGTGLIFWVLARPDKRAKALPQSN